MKTSLVPRTVAAIVLAVYGATRAASPSLQVDGVRLQIDNDRGSVAISAQTVGRFKLKVDVDPKGAPQPFVLRVELPESGPRDWPAQDVVVLDAAGRPILAQRSGLEWHRLLVAVPPVQASYLVQALDPITGQTGPPLPSDDQRQVADPDSGLSATVCRWRDGRQAALSIRFDDSHPTHLSKALPILREHGFKGTFMMNPGNQDFRQHQAEWEAGARRGELELANHTMHHRGAENDEEMDREVGDACQYVWRLLPQKSKLMALNLGGGTTWKTTRPLRYYLDKHRLFDASSGSLGMDDTYGDRADAFRQHLTRHLESGGWCRIHYHSIGEGLASSEANFRAAMEIVSQHQSELWIAGMAEIYKYQHQRQAAKLALRGKSPTRATLQVTCLTDPELYDEPLTIELSAPASWSAGRITVTDAGGAAVAVRAAPGQPGSVFRFDVAPVDTAYVIELSRQGAVRK